MKIEATTAAAEPNSKGPGLQGTKDEFLKLFMAQLQHQDPFDPTSGADMVAQLAQLSSVEQAKQINDRLAELAASQQSAASAGLANLVGRDCSATAGAFQIDRGGAPPPPLDVSSTAPMKGAAVVIKDATGKELRRLSIPEGATSAAIQWDGKDAAGQAVPAGSYEVSIDGGQSARPITNQWHGRVEAVELTEGGPRLRIGGVLLAPSDIRTIGVTQ